MKAFLARMFRGVLQTAGAVFILLLLAAVLGLPWPVYRWLGDVKTEVEGTPDVIVMMGGGGIPSESGLVRSWQTAREAARYPKARVLVAMPYEPGEGATNRSAIQRELILRGVAEHRLDQEGQGRHTHEQAVRVREMLDGREDKLRLMIVTSPEHVRRSVRSFQKAGFVHVRGRAGWSESIEADLTYGAEPSVTKPSASDWVGHSMTLRYRLWDNLGLMIRVSRELTALAYYKVKGWI